MGVFLDKPKKEMESESGEGNGLRYALCSMQGWRVEMEDAHAIRIDLGPSLKDCSYFAVFDGHAGDFVSNYLSENLVETILGLWKDSCAKDGSPLTDSTDLHTFEENVKAGFLKIDSNMRDHPKFLSGEDRSGTTAVTVFVTPQKIIFANCGDSRALLCSNRIVKFVTHDHKPSNEEEKKRIENAGGSVMIHRVNGSLAVSRALGDYDYKNVTGLPPTEQLVSAEPDLNIIDRCDTDEFIILACDGIWDVMTNEDVISYVHSRLLLWGDNLETVCEELLETCLAKGSRDNMSVILITFPAAPKVSNEALEKERQLDDYLKEKLRGIVKYNQNITLNEVLDEMQTLEVENLPPGGGLHSKCCLIEGMLDELLPFRSKEEARSTFGGSFPVPLSMIRQLASDQLEQSEQQDDNL